MSLTIAVTGQAEEEREAELAQVTVSVNLEDKNRTELVTRTEALHNTVLDRLTALSEAKALLEWSAERVYFSKYDRYIKDSEVAEVHHVARSSMTAVFDDFDQLAKFLGEMAQDDGLTVSGVSWKLTPDTEKEIMKRVRIASVQDGLEKAAAYADALGVGTPELVAVYEPGLRPGISGDSGRGYGAPMMARAAMMESDSAGSPEFTLKPGKIRLSAEITADFRAG